MSGDNAFFIGMLTLVAVLLIPAIDTVVGWIGGGRRRRVQVETEYAKEDHGHPELAPLNHEHAVYVPRPDHEAHRTICAQQILGINRGFTEGIEKIERQLDHLRDGINQRLDTFSKDSEARSSKVHGRVDIAEKAVSAVQARVEDHLQDHRAAKGNA